MHGLLMQHCEALHVMQEDQCNLGGQCNPDRRLSSRPLQSAMWSPNMASEVVGTSWRHLAESRQGERLWCRQDITVLNEVEWNWPTAKQLQISGVKSQQA